MKGTKQWNTAGKRKWLCYNLGQSILNPLKLAEVSVRDTIQKWIAIIRDNWTKEQLQVILYYPDQGDREYVADPGKKEAWAAYCWYKLNFWKITPRFGADFVGLVLTPKSSIGNIEKYLLVPDNQSINQTSIAPTSPAKPGSVAQQPNQCSTAKSRKQFRSINRPWGVTVSMGGGGQIKEMCLQMFLEGSNWTGWKYEWVNYWWKPIRKISVLSGFGFILFVDIDDWTEAKHDCIPFSAAAEFPDAKETWSWLLSA